MNKEISKVLLLFKKPAIGDMFSMAIREGLKESLALSLQSVLELEMKMQGDSTSSIVTDFDIAGLELRALGKIKLLSERNIPIFILSDAEIIPEWAQSLNIHFLPTKTIPTELVEKISTKSQMEKSLVKYCRIPVRSLLEMKSGYPYDVYVKISDTKYIKIAHANDQLDPERLEKYLKQGTEQLYMFRSDFLLTLDKMASEIMHMVAHPETVSLKTAVHTTNIIFDTVHAAFEVEGFTPKIKKLAEAAIQLAVDTIQRNPSLGELLKNLNSNHHPYIAWHSNALAFMSCKLATLLDWNSENTFFKLSMAAMLHDITIEDDTLAQLNTLAAIKKANLEAAKIDMILAHPYEASKLVASFEELPGEVSFIIEQHHENQDGTGFPSQLTHKEVSSIAALFSITHDIVDAMYEQKSAFNFKAFVEKREKEEKYSKGSYGQIFRVIAHKYLQIF